MREVRDKGVGGHVDVHPAGPGGLAQGLDDPTVQRLAELTGPLFGEFLDAFGNAYGDARQVPLIAEFDYLINEDNSGDPFDPDPNQHPSLKHMASYSPVVGLGSETAPGEATLTLVNGRYLVSVRADGYKLGGQHIVITDTTGAITVLVELVKDPLPLAQVRVHVFRDNFPVNGEDDVVLGDAPREPGLEGFRVIVESGGEVTVDWYGNPICTEYDGLGASTPLGDPIPGTG